MTHIKNNYFSYEIKAVIIVVHSKKQGGYKMLNLLSSKIFREDLSDYALPRWAFENFEDIERAIDLNTGTYKFCIPVSIGDFSEIKVPACFSNDVEELRAFVENKKQKNVGKRLLFPTFRWMI